MALYVNTSTGNVGIGTNAPRQTLDVNGNLSVSGEVYGGTQLFRNRVINGDMRIDQRNAGNGVGGLSGSYLTYKTNPSSYYTVDRFAVAAPNVSGMVSKQVTLSDADRMATGGNFQYAVEVGQVPKDGLIAYYPFNGDANDASGNGTNLTATGTPSYVGAAVVGTNAVYLANEGNVLATSTAATNYLSRTGIGNNPQLSPVTVSYWMMFTKAPLSGQYSVPLAIYNTAGDAYMSVGMSYSSTSASLLYIQCTTGVTGSTSVSINTWYHIAAIYDPTTGVNSLYLNGVFIASFTGPVNKNFTYQSKLYIGNNYPTALYPFAGMIDDFRIYNRVLTTTEIAALANTVGVPAAPDTTVGSGLTSWLKFDGNTTDTQGTLTSVTPTGTIAYTPVCKVGTNALDLTGNTAGGNGGNYLTYTLASGAYAFPITVCGWINASAPTTAAFQGPFTIGNNSTANSYAIGVYFDNAGSGKIYGSAVIAGTQYNTPLSSFALSAGTWYHIAVTVTASSYVQLFINGMLVSMLATPSGSLGLFGSGTGTINQLRISGMTGTTVYYAFKGLIDDVRIYNRVLTSSEVAGLYATSQYASYNLFQHTIEGSQIADLAWGTAAAQPATVSAWVKNNSSTAQALSLTAGNAGSSSLIAWIDFEGGSYADKMTWLTNATLTGAGTIVAAGKVGTSCIDLTANTAGSAPVTYIDYNVPINIQTPITISAWLFPTTVGSVYQNAISFGSGTTAATDDFTIELIINNSGQLYGAFAINGTQYNVPPSASTAIPANTWTHATVTIAGNSALVYVNGVLRSSLSIITGAITNYGSGNTNARTNTLRLGGRKNAATGLYGYKGYIDDVRIYNKALSPTQIATLYAQNANSTTITNYLTPRTCTYITPTIPANSWQRVTWTIPGDTTGSWESGTDAGLTLSLGLGATALYNTSNVAAASENTVSVWNNTISYMGNSTQAYGTSNSFLSSLTNSLYITGVQLEKGTVVTPFEYRPFPAELALCQRYFEMSYDVGLGYPGVTTSYSWTNTDRMTVNAPFLKKAYSAYHFYDYGQFQYKITKRNAGIFTIYNATTGAKFSLRREDNADINAADAYNVYTSPAGVLSFNIPNRLTSGNGYAFHWTTDAEF